MSGLSWRKSGNSLAPLLSPPQQMCVCIRETLRWPLLHPREPIWALTRRGQGQRARLLLGWALTPLLLLLIVSISNLMMHVHCTWLHSYIPFPLISLGEVVVDPFFFSLAPILQRLRNPPHPAKRNDWVVSKTRTFINGCISADLKIWEICSSGNLGNVQFRQMWKIGEIGASSARRAPTAHVLGTKCVLL